MHSDDDRQPVLGNRPPPRRPFWRRGYWDQPSRTGAYRGPPRGSRSEQMGYGVDEVIHREDQGRPTINYRQTAPPPESRSQPPQHYFYYYYQPPRRNYIPVQNVRPGGDSIPQQPGIKRLPQPQYRSRRPRVPRHGQMAIRRESSSQQPPNTDESQENSSPEPASQEKVVPVHKLLHFYSSYTFLLLWPIALRFNFSE